MAALFSTGLVAPSWSGVVSFTEGGAMQLAVYGAVLAIALGSVLLGLDRGSAPMSPMVDTKAGLSAAAFTRAYLRRARRLQLRRLCRPLRPHRQAPKPNVSAPANPPVPPASRGNLGAPIIAPGLSPSPSAQAATEAPTAVAEPPVRCNVNACTAAYRSFRAADCTYQPSDGPRRLCSKANLHRAPLLARLVPRDLYWGFPEPA